MTFFVDLKHHVHFSISQIPANYLAGNFSELYAPVCKGKLLMTNQPLNSHHHLYDWLIVCNG